MSNNSSCRLEDADVLNFPFIHSLILAHVMDIPLIISEEDTVGVEILNIEYPDHFP